MARSDEGEVILVQDTAALWGDATWANGYLWANLVDNIDPLYAAGALEADLLDD